MVAPEVTDTISDHSEETDRLMNKTEIGRFLRFITIITYPPSEC